MKSNKSQRLKNLFKIRWDFFIRNVCLSSVISDGPRRTFFIPLFPYLTCILKDLVSDPEDEDFQADTEELEEASLTEASSADEAESGEDEDFDVQVINNQFQKLKFIAK